MTPLLCLIYEINFIYPNGSINCILLYCLLESILLFKRGCTGIITGLSRPSSLSKIILRVSHESTLKGLCNVHK